MDLDKLNKLKLILIFIAAILVSIIFYFIEGLKLLKSCPWFYRINPILRITLFIITFLINRIVIIALWLYASIMIIGILLAVCLYLDIL